MLKLLYKLRITLCVLQNFKIDYLNLELFYVHNTVVITLTHLLPRYLKVKSQDRNFLIYLFHLRHFLPMNGLENKTMNIESNDDLENKYFQ